MLMVMVMAIVTVIVIMMMMCHKESVLHMVCHQILAC